MDKRLELSVKNKTDLMPNNASCKRWDTPALTPAQPHWDLLRKEGAQKKTAAGQPLRRPSTPVARVVPPG